MQNVRRILTMQAGGRERERASRKRARNRPNLPQPRILLLCLSLNSAFVCVKVTLTFYTRRAAGAAERNVRKRRTLYMMCGLSSDNERTKGAGRVRFTLDPAGEWMEGWKDAYFYKSAFFPPIRQVIFFPFIRGFIKEIAALERAERDAKVDQNCSLYLNAQLGKEGGF
jgi:hypothetical protein